MGGQIYFVAGEGHVKIGFSTNVPERLRTLRSVSQLDLQLIDAIEGDIPLEKALHGRLDEFRLEGEWYEDCQELRWIIDRFLKDPRGTADDPYGVGGPLGTVVGILWPDDPVGEFAMASGVGKSRAANLMLCQEEYPASIVTAIMGAIFNRQ